jgi:hypothetical protein
MEAVLSCSPKYRPFTGGEGSGGEKFFEISKTFTIQGTPIHPILTIVT